MTSSNRCRFVLLAAALVVTVAPALAAQDLSGSWLMETNANVPDEAEPCVYSGDCVMDQTGNDLTGTVDLVLVFGPPDCAPEMTASLDGNVDGDDVFGSLNSPAFGQANFEGSRANSFVGSFTVEEGDFAGGTGDWTAVRPLVHVTEIPTLAGAGLTLLVLALLASSAWVLRSRRDDSHPA